jgi:hypothetical protein
VRQLLSVRVVLVAGGVVAAVAGGGMAQTNDAVPKTVADCIRANASKVEQSIEPLTAATEFLVGSVCAQEIAAEAQRVQSEAQQRMIDAAQRACDSGKSAVPKQQDAGRRGYDACALLETSKVGVEAGGWTIYAPAPKPPAATALAAKLLLDLRLARATTKPLQDRR